MKATKKEAYLLLHEGAKALAEVEVNGARIDVDYLRTTISKTKETIKDLEHDLKTSEIGRKWRQHFGSKTNFGSSQQLGKILFDVMKFESPNRTRSGKYKTTVEELSKIDHPFIASYSRCEKLKHAVSTFLEGILRETTPKGFAHVNFNLTTAITYRSSSSEFNYQNLPIRDKELGELIRRCFIAREGRRLVESDYGGIEVKIAACYHKDPVMLEYLHDKTKDMHRDCAADCFMVEPDQVSKIMRYCAKNMFVFPEFYGSYFAQCAPNLWEAVKTYNLEVDGVGVYEHLRSKGIKSLGEKSSDYETGRIATKKGTFLNHVRDVENVFWKERFKVYDKWKRDWFAQYQRLGYFNTLTGFTINTVLNRNDVINYPVQGSAFHCLLRSLIEIMRRLKKYKMKSLIIGQIHDSIIGDVVDKELDDYLEIVHEVMAVWLPKRWKWIIVPLEVEFDVTPVNGSWFEKEEMKYES